MSPRCGRTLTIASTSDPKEDEDVIPGNKDAVVVAKGDGDGETREDKAENSLVDFDAGECAIIGPDPPPYAPPGRAAKRQHLRRPR